MNLSPDEIWDMPAGREMDALIISEVMGWKFSKNHEDKYFNKPDSKNIEWMVPYGNEEKFANWSPSKNMAAAYEVILKFRQLCKDGMDEVWDAFVSNLYYDSMRELMYEIEPARICKAALIAKLTIHDATNR